MVKDYNVIIDKLAFFDLPIKTEEEAYEKIIDISRNNEYTTSNFLDYDYFKKCYKLIALDLSKQQVLQENEDLIQQINFIGKLEEAANVFIIIEKKEHKYIALDPSFQGVNRLFVMVYNKLAAANDNQFNRNSKQVYYLPRNDLKKYNVIIDGRNFYDNPIESDIEKYRELKKSNDWKRRRLYYRIFIRL